MFSIQYIKHVPIMIYSFWVVYIETVVLKTRYEEMLNNDVGLTIRSIELSLDMKLLNS